MDLSTPYGETKVHVFEVDGGNAPSVLEEELNKVVRQLEVEQRLVVGPISVLTGKLYPRESRFTYYVVVTTRPGPIHPSTGPGRDAMLERHGLG